MRAARTEGGELGINRCIVTHAFPLSPAEPSAMERAVRNTETTSWLKSGGSSAAALHANTDRGCLVAIVC